MNALAGTFKFTSHFSNPVSPGFGACLGAKRFRPEWKGKRSQAIGFPDHHFHVFGSRPTFARSFEAPIASPALLASIARAIGFRGHTWRIRRRKVRPKLALAGRILGSGIPLENKARHPGNFTELPLPFHLGSCMPTTPRVRPRVKASRPIAFDRWVGWNWSKGENHSH